MGAVRHGVPIELAVQLRDELGLVGAVETGTYLGESTVRLAEHFKHVSTVELGEQLWREAKERHTAVRNVTFLQGASEHVLAGVADAADGPLLYWLDGHWSGGVTAGESNECPLLEEIDAVDASPHGAGSVILIDDARLFLAPPPPPHDRAQWPSLMDVTDKLRATHDRFVTVLEDAIIAVPMSARRVVEDYGMASQWVAASEKKGLLARLRVGRH